MTNLKRIGTVICIVLFQITMAQNKKIVENFNKIIISPHIETTFVQGDENSVTIIENKLSDNKVNINVKGETLRVYLDGAKEITKHKKIYKNGVKMKLPIYKGKVLTIKITYKYIDNLSLRGEQRFVCDSPIKVNKFRLKIYGESQVTFNEVDFDTFDVDMYGEGEFNILKGEVNHQNIVAFGAGKINTLNVSNITSRLKAYGEAEFKIQASNHIKFSAFGEAKLYYKGNAEVSKGLGIGASKIELIESSQIIK